MTSERKRRTTSIKWSLSRNFVAVIISVGLAIFGTTLYTAERIRAETSRILFDRAIGRAVACRLTMPVVYLLPG